MPSSLLRYDAQLQSVCDLIGAEWYGAPQTLTTPAELAEHRLFQRVEHRQLHYLDDDGQNVPVNGYFWNADVGDMTRRASSGGALRELIDPLSEAIEAGGVLLATAGGSEHATLILPLGDDLYCQQAFTGGTGPEFTRVLMQEPGWERYMALYQHYGGDLIGAEAAHLDRECSRYTLDAVITFCGRNRADDDGTRRQVETELRERFLTTDATNGDAWGLIDLPHLTSNQIERFPLPLTPPS